MYQSAVVRRLFTERYRSAEEEILREREREKRRGRVRRGEVVVGVREGQEVRERETGYICSHVKDFTLRTLLGKIDDITCRSADKKDWGVEEPATGGAYSSFSCCCFF